jgi:hypothetical protein
MPKDIPGLFLSPLLPAGSGRWPPELLMSSIATVAGASGIIMTRQNETVATDETNETVFLEMGDVEAYAVMSRAATSS